MKKILGMSILLASCSTTRITYDIGEEIKEPQPQRVLASPPPKVKKVEVVSEREPDIKSVPAQVTFDYPERVQPTLYKVISSVNVRDFPSVKEGNIVGQLKPGETVVGNEIEGSWIRIYENSYTSLKALKPVSF